MCFILAAKQNVLWGEEIGVEVELMKTDLVGLACESGVSLQLQRAATSPSRLAVAHKAFSLGSATANRSKQLSEGRRAGFIEEEEERVGQECLVGKNQNKSFHFS